MGQILEPTVIEQGCSFSQALLFTYQGSAVDLSGYTAVSQIRKTAQSSEIVAAFTMDYTDMATGILRMSLTATQTAAMVCGPLKTSPESIYIFDLLLISGDLVPQVSRPIKASEIQIEAGVTQL